MKPFLFLLAMAALQMAAVPTSVAAQEVDEATASVVPWSGYWFPTRQGALTRYLEVYDQVTGQHAASWQSENRPANDSAAKWFGNCHAHSAASILEREPNQPRIYISQHNQQRYQIGADVQKALLTAAHTNDVSNAWGDRFGDGEGSEDPQDLPPDTLWRLLKLHIGQKGVPLVLDLDPSEEVWNYPVYSYHLEYQPVAAGSDQYHAHLSILMASSAVSPAYLGTLPRKETYQFEFQMRGGSVVVGSARWIGPSVRNHPDFAWYPLIARAENPELNYVVIQNMTGGTARIPQPEGTPSTPVTEPTRPEPTPSSEVADSNTPATRERPASQPPVEATVETTEEPPLPEPARPTVARPETSRPATADTATQPSAPVAETRSRTRPNIPLLTRPVDTCPLELCSMLASETSAFGMDISVDRFDGGKYRVGDNYTVNGVTERGGYFYLFHISGNGTLKLLYPHRDESNLIKAGAIEKQLPLTFEVGDTIGVHQVRAVITRKPLNLTGLVATDRTPQGFVWHTTQARQLGQLLSEVQRNESVSAKQLAKTDLKKLTGGFSQDASLFYVGPSTRGIQQASGAIDSKLNAARNTKTPSRSNLQ